MDSEGIFVADAITSVVRQKAPPRLEKLNDPVLPAADTSYETQNEADDPVPVTLGVAVGIEYVDAADAFSRRTITVRQIRPGLESDQVVAWCHHRNAVRTFRVDRIKALIDVKTGQVDDDSKSIRNTFTLLLNQRLDDALDAARAVIGACAPGVNILCYLSRCDGQEHPEELQCILSYIDSVATDLQISIDLETLLTLLGRMHVSENLFHRSVGSVKSMPLHEVRRLLRYARKLVDADGIISEQESISALELQSIKRNN